MKKFLVAVALTTLTMNAFAGLSDTLLLKGSITRVLNIEVTAEPAASALDLTTTATDLKVASVNEKSNSKTGYKVAISSANLGVLKNGSDDSVAYSLKYDGSAVDLINGGEQSHASAAIVDADKDVTISYTGTPEDELVEGNYSDTVTFTISAI